VYALARTGSTPAGAFLAAGLWLAVPGPVLFLPLADSFFALPAAAGLACFAWGGRNGWLAAPLGALFGGLQWVGMHCSLAFTVVGAAAAILGVLTFAAAPREERVRVFLRLLAVSLAALATFGGLVWWNYRAHGLPLWETWLVNLRKHAGFYAQMPRSYWPWIAVNLLEFLVALGPGAAVLWLVAGSGALRDWRRRPLFWTAAIVLLALDLSGRNLSEAGRLWLFLLPLALAAATTISSACPPAAVDPAAVWPLAVVLLAAQIAGGAAAVAGVEPLMPQPLARPAPDTAAAALVFHAHFLLDAP
jgi:hypothetical protein